MELMQRNIAGCYNLAAEQVCVTLYNQCVLERLLMRFFDGDHFSWSICLSSVQVHAIRKNCRL